MSLTRIIVALVVLASCNSDKSPAPEATPTSKSPTTSLAADAAVGASKLSRCGDLARSMCGAFQRCEPHHVKLKWGDTKNCEAELETDCQTWALPSTGISDTALGSCADAVKDMACSRFNGWGALACEPAWRGSLAVGMPCESPYQCATGSCRKDYKANCHKCAALDDQSGARPMDDIAARKDVGVVCGNDDECQAGLSCMNKRCTEPVFADNGEACTRGFLAPGGMHPCKYGLDCVGDDKKAVCKPLLREGEECKPGETAGCTKPLICNGTCKRTRGDVCKT